jgi:hypothetical protein
MNFFPGASVRYSVNFTDPDNANADPDVVKLYIRPPTGNSTTYTYLSGNTIVKSSNGNYYADVSVNATGTWTYRWEGTGTLQAADEGFVEVRPTRF